MSAIKKTFDTESCFISFLHEAYRTGYSDLVMYRTSSGTHLRFFPIKHLGDVDYGWYEVYLEDEVLNREVQDMLHPQRSVDLFERYGIVRDAKIDLLLGLMDD